MTAQPYNYRTPDWEPLKRAIQAAGLPAETCAEFMWMHEWEQGRHSYKHYGTRGYVVLTADINDQTAADRVRKARCGWQYGAH
jgi:hypothetical protein